MATVQNEYSLLCRQFDTDWAELSMAENMPLLAFSPRARELSLYLMDGVSGQQALLATLGPHRTGKCCLYIRRLSDVSMPALRQLLEASVQALAPLRIR